MGRVAITNTTGFRNTGVEAFTKPVISFLLELFESVHVLSDDPAYDRYRYAHQSIHENHFRVTFKQTPSNHQAYQENLAGSELVVSLGGDVFSSSYADLSRHLIPLHAAYDLNIPIALVGHTFGPFTTKQDFSAFLKAARKVGLSASRDAVSHAFIEGLRTDIRNIHGADPALLITTNRLGEHAWLDQTYPETDVCIAPAQPVARWLGIDEKAHVWFWKRIVETLASRGYTICLMPFAQRFNSPTDISNDDAYLVMNVFDDIEYSLKSSVSVFNTYHRVEAYAYQLSRSKLLVSERMHATLLAISQNVVPITFGYANTQRRVLQDLYEDGFLEFYEPIGDLDPERSIERITYALEHLEELAALTSDARMLGVSRANAMFEELDGFINEVVR